MKGLIRFIKKHFTEKEYNYQNTQTMERVEQKLKQYQWKKGENFGKIVDVKETKGKFTVFTDGSRIFNDVMSEFLDEVVDGKLPFPGADQLGAIANGEKDTKTNIVNTVASNRVINEPVEQEKNPPSAIEELVGKLSKKNIEPLSTVINLNIPNRQIFDMLIENADEDRDNLINTIAKVAVSQIEINKLQEYLTGEVTNFINKYYNE